MKRVYVDMDDTLCDFMGAYVAERKANPGIEFPQSQYGFFANLKPIEDPLRALVILSTMLEYDVWILTKPSYLNPLCYTEKRVWVEKHLGLEWCQRLIICPDKSLLKGDYLIDDILWPGFEGEQLVFKSELYPDWSSILLEMQMKKGV